MVKTAIALSGILVLVACDTSKYTRPIALTPHGSAVRNNMAAQIIDPNPPSNRTAIYDANRPVAAYDAYRKGEVKDPTAQSTNPDTSDADE